MVRPSKAKPAPRERIPKIVFTSGDEELEATEGFHLFSGLVFDRVAELKAEAESTASSESAAELRIEIPESDNFCLDDVKTLLEYVEELKRYDRKWEKRRVGKHPRDEQNRGDKLIPWASAFLENLDKRDMFASSHAASFLQVRVFNLQVVAYVAHQIKGMSYNDMRKYLGIPPDHDFQPETLLDASHPLLRQKYENQGLVPGTSGEK
ncbi:hypothetical protein AAVH_10122 [Aphelenchoides avenae]|nr:hypothetical protein AAVH_10122 [Aphelenchus avenae]